MCLMWLDICIRAGTSGLMNSVETYLNDLGLWYNRKTVLRIFLLVGWGRRAGAALGCSDAVWC